MLMFPSTPVTVLYLKLPLYSTVAIFNLHLAFEPMIIDVYLYFYKNITFSPLFTASCKNALFLFRAGDLPHVWKGTQTWWSHRAEPTPARGSRGKSEMSAPFVTSQSGWSERFVRKANVGIKLDI